MASVLCTRGENGIRAGFRFQYRFGMWVRVPSGALCSSNFFTSYNEGKPFEIFYKNTGGNKNEEDRGVYCFSNCGGMCHTRCTGGDKCMGRRSPG